MVSEGEMLFQLGAIMLLAFLGAVLASRMRQSVMIGYIIIGIFLGPYIHISAFGLEYNGIVTDMTLINAMSQKGVFCPIKQPCSYNLIETRNNHTKF